LFVLLLSGALLFFKLGKEIMSLFFEDFELGVIL
jgi:hypothetical protein